MTMPVGKTRIVAASFTEVEPYFTSRGEVYDEQSDEFVRIVLIAGEAVEFRINPNERAKIEHSVEAFKDSRETDGQS